MDGPKRQLRVRLRVTARRRGGDGADAGRPGAGAGAGGRKRRLDAPALNSAAKLQRREIGGRQLAARGGGPAAAVPERFRNMRLQVEFLPSPPPLLAAVVRVGEPYCGCGWAAATPRAVGAGETRVLGRRRCRAASNWWESVGNLTWNFDLARTHQARRENLVLERRKIWSWGFPNC